MALEPGLPESAVAAERAGSAAAACGGAGRLAGECLRSSRRAGEAAQPYPARRRGRVETDREIRGEERHLSWAREPGRNLGTECSELAN